MPVQTRHTRTAHASLRLQLPPKNKRTLRQKPKIIKRQVYYSDQDISKIKQQSKAIEQTQSIDQPQEISIEPQEEKVQNDVKHEDNAKTCRPPAKRTRKGKQNNNHIANHHHHQRSKQIVTEISKADNNRIQLKIEHQQQSKATHKRIRRTVPHPDDIIIPEETITQFPTIPQQPKMSPLEIEIQKARERRNVLQEQMQMLAKMDCQQNTLLNGPFLVFDQYRPAIESKTELQYRQFSKSCQNMGDNVQRQKIDFSMRRERQLRKHVSAEAIEKYKDMFFAYRELEDTLFYKSKQLNQQQMQEFKRSSQYRDILMKMMQLHPFNAYRHTRTKRGPNLQITTAVSQNFVFTNTRKENTVQRTIYRQAQMLQEQSYSAVASNCNLTDRNQQLMDIKIEGENQAALNSVKNGLPAQINKSVIPDQLNVRQNSSRATLNYQQKSPETSQSNKQLRRKFQSSVEKFVEPSTRQETTAPHYDSAADVRSDPIDEGYNRERILKIINSINEQSNLQTENQEQKNANLTQEKGVSQAVKSKTASVKSQAITNSVKPSIKQNTSQHSQSLVLSTFELNQPKFQGLQQIQIITKRSVEKTDQTTRHDHASANSGNSRNEVKNIRYFNSNQSWEPFSRNPKVKQRLQILNRFHYNPFEIQNGDDQCDLWRRLMSQEIDDLKSHYKYEEPSQYFLSEHQKYDKGYVLPLKVKEEDFFIPSRYDPSNKGLKEEIEFQNNELSNRQGEQLSVKRQIVEYDGFAFVTDLDVPNQVHQQQDGKLQAKERTTQGIAPVCEIVPQESKLDQSGKSFNFDMLVGFWIPDLTQEKEPAKIVQLDLF